VIIYRDEVATISLAQLRGRFAPRVFRKLQSVTLSHGPESHVVVLDRIRGHGCISGNQVAMRCPRCAAHVMTLGFTYLGLACRRCVPWRARGYRVSLRARAPHVGHVAAVADGV